MALPATVMFGYNDQAQYGTLYATNVSFSADYPITNALTNDLYQAAQFVNTTAVIQFTIDLGSQQVLNIIALLKHNIDYTGKWRVLLNQDIVNDPLGNEYDSGFQNVVPATPSFGALAWGQFIWGDAIPAYNLGRYNKHAIMPFSTVLARYVTIQIDCPANVNPIEFFRVWASVGYQPSQNADYGSQVVPIDETKSVKAAAGNRQYGDPIQRRSLVLNFTLLPQAEVIYNIIGGIQLASGVSLPILAILDPTTPQNFYAEAVFGNLQKIDSDTFSSFNRMDASLTIEEQP